MTIETFILLVAIGPLVFLKLAIMVLLVVLLAKTMLARKRSQSRTATASLSRLSDVDC